MDSVKGGGSSETSSFSHLRMERVRSPETIGAGRDARDVLADLSALQREIDALRIRSEKERVQ
jgi:hypothetical protein